MNVFLAYGLRNRDKVNINILACMHYNYFVKKPEQGKRKNKECHAAFPYLLLCKKENSYAKKGFKEHAWFVLSDYRHDQTDLL